MLRLTPDSICQIKKDFDRIISPKVVTWKVGLVSEMYYLHASNIDYKSKTLAAVEIRIYVIGYLFSIHQWKKLILVS